MTFASPFPVHQLLVAFRNGPLDDLSTFIVDAPGITPSPGHWTDVTQWFREATINRGRQHELGQFEAGTFVAPLGNGFGEFNPWTGPQALTPNQAFPTSTTGYSALNSTLTGAGGVLGITAVAAGLAYAFTAGGTSGRPVVGNAQYTASATFSAPGATAVCYLQVAWYDATGTNLGTVSVAFGTDSVPGVLLASTVTSPPTAAFAEFLLIATAAAGGEVHNVTGMSLIRAGQFSTYLAPGGVNPYGGVKLPVQHREYWPGTQLLSPAQRAPGDLSGWAAVAGVTLTAAAGTLTFTATGGGDAQADTSNVGGIPSAPGMVHTAAAKFTAAVTGRTVRILVQYYGPSGLIRQDTTSGADTVGGVTLTYTGTSPAGTTNLAMWLIVVGPAANEVHKMTNMSLTGPLVSYRFTGHATRWVPDWPDEMSTWATLEASDAFRYFNDQQLGNNLYSATVGGGASRYWRCNDAPVATGNTQIADVLGGTPMTVHAGTAGAVATTGASGPLLAEGSSALNFGNYQSNGGMVYATSVSVGSGPYTWMGWLNGVAQGDWGSVVSCLGASQIWQVQMGPNSACLTYAVYLSTGMGIVSRTGTVVVTDGQPHMVEVKYDGATFKFYVDTVLDATIAYATSGGPLYVGGVPTPPAVAGVPSATSVDYCWAGLSVSEVALYTNVTSGPQSAAFYQAAKVFLAQSTGQRIQAVLALLGWPTNLEQIDSGVQQCQQNTQSQVTTTGLTHLQQVEQTEEGTLFMTGGGKVRFVSRQNLATVAPFAAIQCWFGDEVAPPGLAGWDAMTWDGTFVWGTLDLPFEPAPTLALDDIDITTASTCTRVGGLAQTAGTGTRVKGFSGLLHLTDACSLAHAQWIVNKLAIPAVRLADIKVSLLDFLNDVEGVARVLRLDLMSRVSVERTQVGFAQVGIVEHISEHITPESYELTFALSPVDTYPWWSWGWAQ